ncbi:DUF805 domain-containing protein [Sphingobium abikonense]|uniref:DUF805 domain-containing protein n=1 Tax=Sphingobium abikonense TaxID=86193 RepID=UPI000788F23C|nr:DUF805 domain-containing protein [Sphingobium abikonense]
MTYPSGTKAELALLRRTIYGIADFNGRSRRTEVLLYHFAIALVGVMLGFTAGVALQGTRASFLMAVLQIAVILPMFALFARRLHDQNRSAWWVLIMPAGFGWNMMRHDLLATVFPPRWADIIYVCLVIAMLLLLYWPGTHGPNRFGPDPR